MKIENGRAVVVEYELRLTSGEVVDSCTPSDPLRFIFGRGSMLPAFEEHLLGKKKGESLKFTLEPDQGYGPRDEDAVLEMPKNLFPSHAEAGMIFEAETPEGEQALLRILNVGEETVQVDGNHPMAGEQLHFSVKIIDVREPQPDDVFDDEDEMDEEHDHDHDHEHGEGCGGGHGHQH